MASQTEQPSDAVKGRLLRDMSRKGGDVWARQMAQWVGNTAWCADQLCNGSPSEPIASVFWVRLYGTLYDILAALAKHTDFSTKLGVAQDARLAASVRALDKVMNELSREELLYVEYRRHLESHPFQDSYRLRLKKNGDLKDDRTTRLVGVATLEDTDRAVEAIERQYEFSGMKAGVAFAARLLALLNDAVEAVHMYGSPG